MEHMVPAGSLPCDRHICESPKIFDWLYLA